MIYTSSACRIKFRANEMELVGSQLHDVYERDEIPEALEAVVKGLGRVASNDIERFCGYWDAAAEPDEAFEKFDRRFRSQDTQVARWQSIFDFVESVASTPGQRESLVGSGNI